MSILKKFKQVISNLRGDHLDEMMVDLREHSAKTKKRVDEIYNHICLDGEDSWLREGSCNDRK